MPNTPSTPFPLGRKLEHDPRSLNYPAATGATNVTKVYNHYGPVLDQGQTSSCTGNAMAQWLNTAPYYTVPAAAARPAGLSAPTSSWSSFLEGLTQIFGRKRKPRPPVPPKPAPAPGLRTETDALALYSLATQLDGFPGTYPPDDSGSSGLAVAQAAVQKGYTTSYTHAFGLDHAVGALQLSPVIVGTDWHNDMFQPDAKGFVHPTGAIAGGHEYLLYGVNVEQSFLTFLNSWGSGWGQAGTFYMTFADFNTLLTAGGDVTVPVK